MAEQFRGTGVGQPDEPGAGFVAGRLDAQHDCARTEPDQFLLTHGSRHVRLSIVYASAPLGW